MFWRYLRYLLRHKWFVFIECCKLGIPWRGIVHDLSKFLPSEWSPYMWYYYGPWQPGKQPSALIAKYEMAWLRHQHRNLHHWEMWICPDLNQKLISFANVANANGHEKISSMAGGYDTSVPNISGSIPEKVSCVEKTDTLNIIAPIPKSTLTNIDKIKSCFFNGIVFKYWNTMVDYLQSVLAAVKRTWSFFVWTISLVAGQNIENNSHQEIQRGQEAYQSTAGQLNKDTHQFFKCFVTTATPQSAIMATVPIIIFPMPDKYRREMLADWRGAGRALRKPDTKAWYKEHAEFIILHPETRTWIEANL